MPEAETAAVATAASGSRSALQHAIDSASAQMNHWGEANEEKQLASRFIINAAVVSFSRKDYLILIILTKTIAMHGRVQCLLWRYPLLSWWCVITCYLMGKVTSIASWIYLQHEFMGPRGYTHFDWSKITSMLGESLEQPSSGFDPEIRYPVLKEPFPINNSSFKFKREQR